MEVMLRKVRRRKSLGRRANRASPKPATEPAQTRSSARRRLLDAAPGLNKSVKVSDPLDMKDTKRRLNFGDRAVAKKRLRQSE